MGRRRSFADPTHPQHIKGAIAVSQAVQLRAEGKTYQEIADILGYADHTGARKAVLSGLASIKQEPAQELRDIELARLDALWQKAWDKAMAGSMPAIDRCLKIQARRAALMGLDAPKEVDVKVTVLEEADRLADLLNLPREEVRRDALQLLEVEGRVLA